MPDAVFGGPGGTPFPLLPQKRKRHAFGELPEGDVGVRHSRCAGIDLAHDRIPLLLGIALWKACYTARASDSAWFRLRGKAKPTFSCARVASLADCLLDVYLAYVARYSFRAPLAMKYRSGAIITSLVRVFICPNPFIETRASHEPATTQRDRRQGRSAMDLTVDDVANVCLRAPQLTGNLGKRHDV